MDIGVIPNSSLKLSSAPSLVNLSIRSSTIPFFKLQPLPSTLTHLYFDFTENKMKSPLKNLPSSLTSLELIRYPHEVNNLPSSITHLSLSFFNKSVDHLPLSLTHLTLGREFNQPLDHLPPSLLYLDLFFSDFNYPLKYLPDSLHILYLSLAFNQPIEFLPLNLTHLRLGPSFTQKFYSLPPYLVKLDVRPYSKCSVIPKYMYLAYKKEEELNSIDLDNLDYS